jgi:hypothetical protein
MVDRPGGRPRVGRDELVGLALDPEEIGQRLPAAIAIGARLAQVVLGAQAVDPDARQIGLRDVAGLQPDLGGSDRADEQSDGVLDDAQALLGEQQVVVGAGHENALLPQGFREIAARGVEREAGRIATQFTFPAALEELVHADDRVGPAGGIGAGTDADARAQGQQRERQVRIGARTRREPVGLGGLDVAPCELQFAIARREQAHRVGERQRAWRLRGGHVGHRIRGMHHDRPGEPAAHQPECRVPTALRAASMLRLLLQSTTSTHECWRVSLTAN